jgi:hypothetical protein
MRPRMHKTPWLPASRLVHTTADCAFPAAKLRPYQISEVGNHCEVHRSIVRGIMSHELKVERQPTCYVRKYDSQQRHYLLALGNRDSAILLVTKTHRQEEGQHLPHEAGSKSGRIEANAAVYNPNSSTTVFHHHVASPVVWKRLSGRGRLPSLLSDRPDSFVRGSASTSPPVSKSRNFTRAGIDQFGGLRM